MSIIISILISTLSITTAIERNGRYEYQHRRGGQMGFKWTRQQYTRGKGMRYGHYPSNTEEPETDTTDFKLAPPLSFNEPDIPEPTLYPEDAEQTIPPQVVIDDAAPPEIVDQPPTMDIIENTYYYYEQTMAETEVHQPPIMDCLYGKCQDSFHACFYDEQCKEFMREWQETQSLRPECLPSTKEETKDDEVESVAQTTKASIENTEILHSEGGKKEPLRCQYDELFWNVYHCGVENYCYNDQLVSAAFDSYVSSPSNFRVSPKNVTVSKSSSYDSTFIMVAITSAISAVILYEVCRRLYNGLKDKFEWKWQCECVKLQNSWRYLTNKWEQIRGYKYQKTHVDIDAIGEEDAEMYGDETTNIGVTYNGVINDSDTDEELQKCSSKPMPLDPQTKDDEDRDDFIVSDKFMTYNCDQKEEEEPIQPL